MPARRSRASGRSSNKRGGGRSPSLVKLGPYILKFDMPRVMGIVNNTPDSFSGDGLGGDVGRAVERGISMFESGADLVDVGGESTRPGAESVSLQIELARTAPVVKRLSDICPGRVSIDTMKPELAERALSVGATVVNDVSGLRDPKMIDVVAEHDAAAIIMHMKGDPKTMQVRPRYVDVVAEIKEYLEGRISAAERAGVSPKKIFIDPGIGFGKTLEHNVEIIARLKEFRSLGKPIVIGVSRKSFIGRLTGLPPEQRLEGSIAAAVLAVREGAQIVRVHDVPETVRALKVADGILSCCGHNP